jgi:hypothetical protein
MSCILIRQYENRSYILSEFSDQTFDLHQARQTPRELINLTGLYTKVRPHIHLSLNKHGRPKLTQRMNIGPKHQFFEAIHLGAN